MQPDSFASVTPSAAPAVSVIVIFLNPQPFFEEAVESIFQQTCTDWELLLVDDGSSDGSAELAKRYASRHPDRVRYLEHPQRANLGMSASRNLGLQHARGKCVSFLDADDIYLPKRLEKHLAILDAYPNIDMVQSDLIFWYSWQPLAERLCDDQVRPFLAASDRVLTPPEGLLTVLASPFLAAGICNITVRRDVALALGGFEPRFRALYEDQVFVTKVYLEKRVYVLQEYLAKYRRHPGSWVRRMKDSGEFVEGMANAATHAFHGWLCDYVDRRGLNDKMLDEALRRLTMQPAVQKHSSLRRFLGAVITAFKQSLPTLLPRRLHRRLLHWTWERQVAQALRGYRGLCVKMQQVALKSGSSGENALR